MPNKRWTFILSLVKLRTDRKAQILTAFRLVYAVQCLLLWLTLQSTCIRINIYTYIHISMKIVGSKIPGHDQHIGRLDFSAYIWLRKDNVMTGQKRLYARIWEPYRYRQLNESRAVRFRFWLFNNWIHGWISLWAFHASLTAFTSSAAACTSLFNVVFSAW